MSWLSPKDELLRAQARKLVAALPKQTPEAIYAEADRVQALIKALSGNPGNYNSFFPVANADELIPQAEQILGTPFYREREPDDLFGQVNGEWWDYSHNIFDLQAIVALLEVLALGDKPYPLGICGRCKQVISWPGDGGYCDDCREADRYWWQSTKLPSAWIGPIDAYDHMLEEGKSERRYSALDPQLLGPSRLDRFGKHLWARTAYDRKRLRAWNVLISDRGECGPLAPEEGFTIEVPIRCEQRSTNPMPTDPKDSSQEAIGSFIGAAATDDTVLIRFYSRAYTWHKDRWVEKTRQGRYPDYRFPNAFSAELPIETLVSAWEDFCERVYTHNEQAWQTLQRERGIEGDRKLTRDVVSEDKARRLREASGTLELMDGLGSRSRSKRSRSRSH